MNNWRMPGWVPLFSKVLHEWDGGGGGSKTEGTRKSHSIGGIRGSVHGAEHPT